MTRTHEKVSDAPEGEAGCLEPDGAADLVQRALRVLGGRWKLAIIFRLFRTKVLRFSELEREITGISQKMLVQHLRALERDGVVRRTVHATVPPRVEYSLTASGEALRPALKLLREWAREVGGETGRS